MDFNDISLTQSCIANIISESVKVINKIAAERNITAINSECINKRYRISDCRQLIRPYFNSKIQNKVQVFYNFKGGTGKTTLCFQVASMLALFGFNVLAIDLDPQGHLTGALRFNENDNLKTLYDVMINGKPVREAIHTIYEGLSAIPSNLSLTRIEVPLSQKMRREEILNRLLEDIKSQYDFILIDTNPTISTLNLNALFTADKINIVCETQPFSLNGLCILTEELERIFSDLGKNLNLSVIANKFEVKTATSQEVLGALRMDYAKEMYDAVIRKCEDINISTKKQMPVVCFAGKSSSAFEDLRDLVKEMLSDNS